MKILLLILIFVFTALTSEAQNVKTPAKPKSESAAKLAEIDKQIKDLKAKIAEAENALSESRKANAEDTPIVVQNNLLVSNLRKNLITLEVSRIGMQRAAKLESLPNSDTELLKQIILQLDRLIEQNSLILQILTTMPAPR